MNSVDYQQWMSDIMTKNLLSNLVIYIAKKLLKDKSNASKKKNV